MIAASSFDGKSVAVFGLGGSGVVVIEALQAGGAEVSAWDDNQGRVEALKSDGLPIVDLNEADFSTFDALVLAPGVPLTHPEPHWTVKKAQAAGIEIIGDVELFVRERAKHAPEAPFIAITGTNGKSTTTALISHILKQAGRDVQMGGNIGRAVLSLDPPSADKIYVVECSSYQIDLAPSLNPSVGILLNVTPDHLDRHGTIEHYAAVKEQLVQGADHAIVSVDDAFCLAIAERLSAEVMSTEGEADLYRDGTKLFHKGVEVANIAGIGSLRGDHNVQNALAALVACRQVGLSYAEIQAGFESFGGLPHRMEEVAQHENILFVNDSKATNAEAAAKALGSFERIYWIAGGKAKSDGIDSLNEFFPRITETFLIGDASEQFAATLAGVMPTHQCGTLDVAVAKAAEAALASGEKGVVLLSPACASFDQFANFEVRGDAFRAAVNDFLDAL